ncbi:hypothetical protein [Mesorhizobium sp. M0195]|uniref:hypothetical protein n=1 Tax=Mesorhizobium sp. M0195 TaxID=2956910 RepID=UPI003339364A
MKLLVRPRGVLVSRKIKHLGCPTGRRAPIENIAAFAALSNRPSDDERKDCVGTDAIGSVASRNSQDPAPTADEHAGMAWWNALDEGGRRDWMQQAGNTGRAADAWKAYKRACPNTVGSGDGIRTAAAENWSELAAKAHVVDAASRLFGARAARQLWQDLGLPAVGKSPGPPDLSLLHYVAAFVEARLVADCRVGIAARQLHKAYIEWADETIAPHLTLTRFGLLMQKTAIRRVAGRIVTYEARFK